MKGKSAAKAPPKTASRAATAEEVSHAIEALTLQDSVRLSAYSKNRIAAIGPHAANGRNSDDLFQEAVIRMLDGRRHWFPDNVDIVKYLIGAIESIASEWAGHRKRNRLSAEYAGLESQLAREDDSGKLVSPFDGAGRDGSPNVEEEAVAADIEAERKELADEIEAAFSVDEEASMVIIGLESGMNGPTIQQDLGWSDTKYRTTVRRIKRRAEKISERRYGR
jgi:hypothetical protein